MSEILPYQLEAGLHHLCISSDNVAALAKFYEKNMGLTLQDVDEGVLGIGQERRILFVKGEPKKLMFAGLKVDTQDMLNSLAERLNHASIDYEIADDHPMFKSGALKVRDPDGNQIVFGIADEAGLPAAPEWPTARLQHFVVASRDAERLMNFYSDVLGFAISDQVKDDHDELKTAFLRCGQEHHTFAVFQASSDRFDHHCYEAGEWNLLRDWADRFASNEIKIEWGPGRHGPGNNLFIFVHDPDGNWLEISAELERVPHDKPAGVWPQAQRTLNLWGSAPLRT